MPDGEAHGFGRGGMDDDGPGRSARELQDPVVSALDECDRIFAEHLAAAEERFGACVFGLADLPPLTGGNVEPDQLRIVPCRRRAGSCR